MKTLTYLLLSTLAFALPLQAQIVVLEYWDFESDSVNTDLNELINSGSINSSWNFNTPSDLTDGSGLFVLGGNSGTYTRKAPADPYSSPLTTGKYVLEVKFDSWSADTASNGDSWNIKMNDSSGNTIAGIYWEVDSASTVRLRASTSAVTGSYFRNFTGYGLTESNPVTVAVEIDCGTCSMMWNSTHGPISMGQILDNFPM
jgi:hypothetical protein